MYDLRKWYSTIQKLLIKAQTIIDTNKVENIDFI